MKAEVTAADLLVLASWQIFGVGLAAICYRLLMLYFLGGWGVWLDYNVATENDYTMWTVPGIYWQIGGAFVIAVIAVLVGVWPATSTAGSPGPHSSWSRLSPGPRRPSRPTSSQVG